MRSLRRRHEGSMERRSTPSRTANTVRERRVGRIATAKASSDLGAGIGRDLTKSHECRRNESVRRSIAMPMSAAEYLSRGEGMVTSPPTRRSRDLRARQYFVAYSTPREVCSRVGSHPSKGGHPLRGCAKIVAIGNLDRPLRSRRAPPRYRWKAGGCRLGMRCRSNPSAI